MYRQRPRQSVLSTHNAKHPVWEHHFIEVSPLLPRQLGYRVPIRLSSKVCRLLISSIEDSRSPNDRLWNLLYMARIAISNAQANALATQFYATIDKRLISFWAYLDTNAGSAIHVITRKEYSKIKAP